MGVHSARERAFCIRFWTGWDGERVLLIDSVELDYVLRYTAYEWNEFQVDSSLLFCHVCYLVLFQQLMHLGHLVLEGLVLISPKARKELMYHDLQGRSIKQLDSPRSCTDVSMNAHNSLLVKNRMRLSDDLIDPVPGSFYTDSQ